MPPYLTKEKTMKRWRIWLTCLVVYVLMLGAFSMALGQEARERVFDLPQDETKWFISVVGEKGDSHYQMLLAWFDENADLNELKEQVHFHMITTGSVAYKERYADNTPALPMVRLQRADGYVAYEAASGALPDTSGGLLTEMGYATHLAGGPIFNRDGRIFPIFPIFRRPLLPYRYRQEQLRQEEDCDTCPAPPPAVPETRPRTPAKPPEPKGISPVIATLLALFGAGAGGIGGAIKKWKDLTNPE
jgi:hypothetical protein